MKPPIPMQPMKPDPGPGVSRKLLELAEAVADGRTLADDNAVVDADPREQAIRANLLRLASFAAAARGPADAGVANKRWGHLEVGELLGAGSFGRVYSAWDTVLQRSVALKLRQEQTPGMDAFGYIEEARRLARVRHPHVLAVHGADIHDNEVGLWSDLIQGETLESTLSRDGRLPTARVLPLAQQLAEALAAVHAADLIHGDVKASNVMLDEQGAAILMDFGAGTDTTSPESPGIGSPLAMAPERLAGSAQEFAADIYALGVLIFRLLSGRYPIEADDLAGLRAKHQSGVTPDWTLLPTTVPKQLRDLLDRMLARQPQQRPSAVEVAERLRWLRAAPQRRRRHLAIAAIIAALSVGLIVASVGYRQATYEAARSEQVKDFVLSLFDRADITDADNAGELTAAALLRSGADQVEQELADQPRVQAELLVVIGGGLLRLQDMPAARSANLQALKLYQRMRNPDPELHAAALSNLGIIDSHEGESPSARQHYEQALAVLDAAGLADVDVRFSVRTGLARIANQQGDFRAALAMRQSLLVERIAAFGAMHPAVAMDNYNLAASYMNLDRYADAEAAYRRCESILLETLGRDHSRLLLVDSSHANALRNLGKLDAAEQHAHRAVEGWRSRRVTDGPHYAHALEALAAVLIQRHQPQRACRLIEGSLAIPGARQSALGWRHYRRGECLGAQQRWTEAEAAFAQAESLAAGGVLHADFVHLNRALRVHAAWHGRGVAVEPIKIAAILPHRNVENMVEALTASVLGRTLREQGDVTAALPLLERARERIAAAGYLGAIGLARADAEVALTRAVLPQAGATEREQLAVALAKLTSVDPESPLRAELAAARSAPIAK